MFSTARPAPLEVIIFFSIILSSKKFLNRKKELNDLRLKSEKVKGFRDRERKYLLVSKNGFRKMTKGRDVTLWDKSDVEDIIRTMGN